MDDAISEFIANLQQRDRREQAQAAIIDQYTIIADKLAASREAGDTSGAAKVGSIIANTSSAAGQADTSSLRTSLAEAQKARAALEAEIATFKSLKQDNLTQALAIQTRDREIGSLQRKVQDRNEEIREGKKLIEQVQDEMVSLNLQLNMAEQKAEALRAENQDLIKRWMKKMGQEADQMNQESKW